MKRLQMAPALRTLLVCTLALLVGSAGAQSGGTSLTSYDVELVIFRNLGPVGSNEQLSLESVTPAVTAATALVDEEADGATASNAIPEQRSLDTFPALPGSKFKLGAIEDALRRSRNYQVLAHIGWIQPGYPRNDAHYLAVDPLVANTAGLGGRMALTRGRYLHLALDVTYQSPEDAQKYSLRQTRRMRSNERHYIDHPKFGVIALVVPSS
jgi:hypothetical protein